MTEGIKGREERRKNDKERTKKLKYNVDIATKEDKKKRVDGENVV